MINLITETPFEKWRAETLFTKEPGTVAWIERECQLGDVFYDVGANIGQYTLMAARKVMPGGAVIAFEPHLFNAASLLRNVAKNKAQGVQLVTSALYGVDGFYPFHYQRLMAGSSGSQLGEPITENGERFVPEGTEVKHTTTVDRLVSERVIPPPSLVKIDVDGAELSVLNGLRDWLRPGPLRSVQVEVHPRSHPGVLEFMVRWGWREAEIHHTAFGQEAIKKGIDPDDVFRNVIYARAA